MFVLLGNEDLECGFGIDVEIQVQRHLWTFEIQNQIHQRYPLPVQLAAAELPVENKLLLFEVG